MADERKRRWWRIGVEVLFVLLMLYALSWGPLTWLEWHDYIDPSIPWQREAVEIYGTPVGWICETVPGADAAFGWYVGLWID